MNKCKWQHGQDMWVICMVPQDSGSVSDMTFNQWIARGTFISMELADQPRWGYRGELSTIISLSLVFLHTSTLLLVKNHCCYICWYFTNYNLDTSHQRSAGWKKHLIRKQWRHLHQHRPSVMKRYSRAGWILFQYHQLSILNQLL